jgi:RNA polymerase sigma-70 factor (ECF subfamily)
MTNEELTQLYERYAQLVHRRCQRLLGSAADADDAMHDVFLRAQRSAPPRTAGSTLVWLYRIATHCCFDRLRSGARAARHQRTLDDAGAPVLNADADQRALVGMVLRKVDAVTCELALLHHLDGLTQEEIALESGYSRRTIVTRLQRFAEEFKTRWTEAGGAS